jgi:mannose-6-phosphate isomerase
MFVGLTNTPRDYAWGSTTEIADLLGRAPSGLPEAEYWLGTHPGSPSHIRDPASHGEAATLSELTTLPFLLKVLAADAPLSLQAHPTTAQARAGFARENAEGIPLNAPNRNYKDAMHKPELIFALREKFAALCGFRAVVATRELLAELGPDAAVGAFLDRLADDASLRSVFEWLLSRTADVDALVDRIVELSRARREPEFELVVELARSYPRDPGIVIVLLLNYVVLKPGEALYLPAGNIHMYLRGLGVELMAASDNVLRGGLTPKHVDVPELLAVLDFRPVPVPYLVPERPSPGLRVYRPDVPDFELAVIDPAGESVRFAPAGESILLCTNGAVTVTGTLESHDLVRGESEYVTADEGTLTFSGSGTVFLATTNPGQGR